MRLVVAPFRREHVARVAELHCSALPGLLSLLGRGATVAFYSGYVDSRRCVGFVDEHDDVVRGFIVGSDDPQGMRRDAMRANGSRILLSLATGVVRRPGVLRPLVDAVVGLRYGGFDSHVPELTYIAVRSDARGAGIGSALLTAFDAALRARGVNRYELSVEDDNHRAVAFYNSHGLRQTGTYRQFSTMYRRYQRELPPVPGTRAR
jgi:ribosomal protein S18 acetylase RimI-like enzyme